MNFPGPARTHPRNPIANLDTAFTRKVRESTCLVWVGATNSRGYGVATVSGHQELAHRVAYEAEYGPIPDGMVLDHLCRVRNCVRPEHLEPVTVAENTRRGRSANSLQVGDTCQNGHLITDGLLYRRPSGATECMECRRVGKRANRANSPRPTRQKRSDSVRQMTDLADTATAAASWGRKTRRAS